MPKILKLNGLTKVERVGEEKATVFLFTSYQNPACCGMKFYSKGRSFYVVLSRKDLRAIAAAIAIHLEK